MHKNKHPYTVTIGRTREVRGPDALEMVLVWAIIFSIIVVPMVYGLHQVRMAEVSEPVSLVNGSVRYDLIVYRSLYGSWPSTMPAGTIKENESGAYLRSLKLGHHGAITARVVFLDQLGSSFLNWDGSNGTSGLLSFRPVVVGAKGYGSLLLLCGYASPPPGVSEPSSVNRTTLDNNDLTPDCREGGE